jgi:hypothetical protein
MAIIGVLCICFCVGNLCNFRCLFFLGPWLHGLSQKKTPQNTSRWELDCERRAKNDAELRQAINILSGVDAHFISYFV